MLSIKPIQTQPFTLAGAGASLGSTTLVLSSFQQIGGTNITMTDLGDVAYATIEPNSKDNEEQISFTGVTQNGDGTATLTGIKTVLFASPYTETSGLAKTHTGGVSLVLTNTSGFYNQYPLKGATETVSGAWTFSTTPKSTGGTPSANTDLTTKAYVLSIVTGGTVTNTGVVVDGIAGETLVAGNLVYFKTSDQRWWKTDADTSSTVEGVILGIAQGAGSAGGSITTGVLIYGLDSNQSGLTAGNSYYASNTAGALSSTAGTTSKIVGIAKSTTSIFFDPELPYTITANQLAALAGTGGTPSSTNKFITAGDTTYSIYSTGDIKATYKRVAPSGWLYADGSAISRSTYSSLFSTISPNIGTFTVTIANPAVVTLTSHGLITGDQIYLTTTGALPSGLSANTLYYVIKVGADTFNLATSRVDAFTSTKITTTGTQSGTHTLYYCPFGLGDGSTTFNLPDLKGKAIVGLDTGDTTDFTNIGKTGGEKTHQLSVAELATHTHKTVGTGGGTGGSYTPTDATTNGTGIDTSSAGSNTAHNNIQPYSVWMYIIKV